MNDVVVHRGQHAQLITLDCQVDDEFLTEAVVGFNSTLSVSWSSLVMRHD